MLLRGARRWHNTWSDPMLDAKPLPEFVADCAKAAEGLGSGTEFYYKTDNQKQRHRPKDTGAPPTLTSTLSDQESKPGSTTHE